MRTDPPQGSPLCPWLPRHAGTRGQVPSKGHQSYICLHLVDKRPGPKYAVCDSSYELSRYFLVKIITGFCSFSYCDYRVLRSCTFPPPRAAFSLVTYRSKWDGIPLPAACIAAPSCPPQLPWPRWPTQARSAQGW